MTDSIERKGETKAELQERLKDMRAVKMSDRVESSQVPRWVKHAFAKMEILGYTYKEACKEFNKKEATLSNYKGSPWVQQWRASLREIGDDPIKVAEMILRGSIMEAALDQIWATEAAKALNDYKEVRLGTKDLLVTYDLIRPQASKQAAIVPVINITLPSGSNFQPIEVTTETVAIEAEYTVDDDD